MTHLSALVIAFKTLALVFGGLITYFATKAYRRTGSPALRALAVGFGFVTLGAILAGAFDQFLMGPDDRTVALAVESLLTTVGFGVILYSLYAD
ncbi:DUF7521 family protein [Haloarchaeobius iranensis]|uniref:YapH protein n=1 Tax=Haloarchaeobius iranensis TaxID=996166 RepID=A0A1H0AZD7_9EURY|nr:hypothetical protein [Haloarchaeobius iranensis]SDN38423.1 hypothetical protein SAMN05192554_13127 [Haloarchaeobius iranensis]